MKIYGSNIAFIRQSTSMNMLRFVSKPSQQQGNIVQSIESIPIAIKPNPLISKPFESYNSRFANCNDFLNHKYIKEYPPTHARIDILPTDPTDIKGVDPAMYKHIQRKQVLKKLPILISNKFFNLKFFPNSHHVSLVRKSNIAYTFTNRGGYKLNDPALEKAMDSYRGKYRSLSFFQENLYPMDTAVGRTKYRKLVKRSLFNSLHKYVRSAREIDLVSGVFCFRFMIVPVTDVDKLQIHKDIDDAVLTLLNDTNFRQRLNAVVKDQNKMLKNGEVLLREVSKFSTLGAKNVPGYYPKLPFMYNKNKLI